MANLLAYVGMIVQAAVGWVGEFAGVITASTDGTLDNPIILVFVILSLAGIGVGFLKRLMRL